MKTRQQLQRWFDNLPLEDRLALQIFVVKLYGMEKENGKS